MYAENLEANRAAKRERYASSDKAKRREYSKIYREQNSERLKRLASLWIERNRHKVRAKWARRNALLLSATPCWADKGKIESIYKIAKQIGHQVDHIVPLRSEIVCGLHCEANLQTLTEKENKTKSNKFWPDMP